MRSLLRAGLALGLLAGACKDSSEPTLANPNAVAAELAAANEAFDTPVFRSFDALDNVNSPFAAPAQSVLLAARPRRLEATGNPTLRSVATAERLRSLVPALGVYSRQDSVIPDALVGTWVWDVAGDVYVKSGTRPAPANTIRIILYVTDDATDMPVEPLDEIGYLDVTDQQPATPGYAIGITVKDSLGTTTYLDYDVTVTPGTNSFAATSVGWVTNALAGAANRTLDFDLSVTAAGSETSGTVSADALFDLNNPSISLELHDDATFSATTATFSRDFRFSRPGETITLVGVLTLEQLGPDSVRITIDITVRVNGRLYASLDGTITISGDTITETVTVTGPGRDNEALLAALTLASADLFDVIDDLLDPIESLSP